MSQTKVRSKPLLKSKLTAAGNGGPSPRKDPGNGDGAFPSSPSTEEANALSPLGEKIFLDRYALKDVTKRTLTVGDTVVVCVDLKTGQREIGTVEAISQDKVRVCLREGEVVERSVDQVDKPLELRPEELMGRVARGIAAAEEPTQREEWERRFRWLLEGWKFVPGGRILSSAGTDQQLTYYNCYVVPSPGDSRKGIVEALSRMMEIMSRGGGVGINMSTLRPRHSYVRGVNGRSSGTVSWGALFSFVTGLIEQGGSRRGALMLILEVWHPDVLEFINSKREMGKITNANISVAVTDQFMEAVKKDEDWETVFPDTTFEGYDVLWDGDLEKWRAAGRPVIVHKTVKARVIWNAIIEGAWASAEPGVFYVDRYNAMSNSWYYAPIRCTNPCGEQGLPPWGVCNLGALNLAKFVKEGEVDWADLGKAVRFAVRFLDDVIDVTPYFFEQNAVQQRSERRVGLGSMGLAEMMIRLGIRYGSPESVEFIDEIFRFIAEESYLASCEYAQEKGAFPMFDSEKFLQSGFARQLPERVQREVAQGVRNATLLTQAPNGTTGTMVGTSTGIEPYYSWTYLRKSRLGIHEERVAVVEEWQREHADEELPPFFVTAMDLTPEEHIRVQAAVQRWVDASISKTCNTPNDSTVEQIGTLYELMYEMGCKGGTVYRDGSRDEQVLQARERAAEAAPQPKVRPRPYKCHGVTVSRPTPAGTAHITMNDDEEGHPFEVFVEIGKGGSDIKAMAEATGRLISLVLRLASPLSPVERVQEIVNQLRGIGGARSLGFGKDKVLSLPDAVARALEEHYSVVVSNGNGGTAAQGAGMRSARDRRQTADICPGCGNAAFVQQEGCHTCQICGYSEC